VLIADDDPDVFNDKDALSADPRTPGRLYAVWDRLTGLTQPDQPIGTGPTWLARATGGVWEPARPIYDPGIDAQTLGNVVAVLPDGTLVDGFLRIQQASTKTPMFDMAVIRSADGGDTWSAAVSIAPVGAVGVVARDGIPMRTGAGLPQIAADPTTGTLYIAWESAIAEGGVQIEGIVVARSRDAGVTWDPPVRADGAGGAFAFTPQIAVASDGTVGTTYYDFRDPAGATAWLATSQDAGATWSDERLSDVFALDPARVNNYYFLGDYEGLVARAARFVPLFALAFTTADPTDIVVRP